MNVNIPAGTDFNNHWKEKEEKGLFLVRTGNRWIETAKDRPIPGKLYNEFWYQQEVCILFADTNLGKSILAVQIGEEISRKGIKVLFCDFELSDKQFEARYSNGFTNHYQFSQNFYRAEINPDTADYKAAGYNTLEDYLNASLEQSIIETEAKVVIIDNITYLRAETEKAKDALPLMKHLKSLKNKHNLSILALAHTPKRDQSKPISRNDLQGSKMLINFCDSCFAIGESSLDKSVRYLKQIKARNCEIIYDAENVALYQIGKPLNFLMFEFLNYGRESEHLRQPTDQEKEQLDKSIIDLYNSGTIVYREIARQLNTNPMRVKRVIDRATEDKKTDKV